MTVPKKWSTLSNSARIWTVLGGLVLGCVLIGILKRGEAGAHPSQVSPSLNLPAVDFASFLVEDDIQTALEGGERPTDPASDGGTFVGWSGLDGRITAKEYEAAYDANEIAADNKFKGKRLLLSGIIASVEKDFTGQGYLTLRGSEPFLGVHAQLSDHSMAEAATLNKGQNIRLVCEGGGRMATVAILDHCDPLKDYINRISPLIKSRMTEFLSGKVTLNQTDAKLITFSYATAESMPANSRCLAGVRDTCAAEMKAVLEDKTLTASIREHMNKLMATLKSNPQ